MRLVLIVICILSSGCGRSASTPPQVPVKSTNNQPEAKVVNDELSDVNLEPSEKSVDDVKAFIKLRETTTDQLNQFVKTTPILVRNQRFHWILKDGSIWTDIQPGVAGAVIVKVTEEKN